MTRTLPDACPSENALLDRALGHLSASRATQVDEHLDACESCRIAFAGAVRHHDSRPFLALATFSPGEVIGGRYVIVRRLGVGGMGEVYEVRDDYLDEVVALKTLTPTIADSGTAIARLKAEVRLARRVTHENVCRIYDLGFHHRGAERLPFLTMELVSGVTLRQRIVEGGPLDPPLAESIAQDVARGLAHAHAAGIVHRDLKIDNVMLVTAADGSPDRVVVMDFGLARAGFIAETQPLTPESHRVLGTLDYLSPEQVKGLPATVASDVYALGIVMYEMMTGRLPFEGETPLARALARVTHEAPKLRSVLPGADARHCAFVERCLTKDTRDRFASMEEALGALGTPTDPDTRRPNRFSWWLQALLVLGGIGAGYALSPSRQVGAVAGPVAAPTPATASAPAASPVPAPVLIPDTTAAPVTASGDVRATASEPPAPLARAPELVPTGAVHMAVVNHARTLPTKAFPPVIPSAPQTVPPPVQSSSPSGDTAPRPSRDGLLNPFRRPQ